MDPKNPETLNEPSESSAEGYLDAKDRDADRPEGNADAKEPKSALDIVKAEIAKSAARDSDFEETEDEDDSDFEEEEDADSSSAETEQDESEDEDEKLEFHKHPRWQEMKAERDQLRQERDDAVGQLDSLRSYLSESNINDNDFTSALEMTRKINQGDASVMKDLSPVVAELARLYPEQAIEALAPAVQQLQSFLGNVLPKDIQEMVDSGQMTKQAARLMARERAKYSASDTQRQYKQNLDGHSQQQRALQMLHSEAQAAERRWKESDPDYARKADPLKKRVNESMQVFVSTHGRYPSQQEARAVIESAEREINSIFKSARPQNRRKKNRVRTEQSVKNAKVAPKSSLDIVKRVIGQSS